MSRLPVSLLVFVALSALGMACGAELPPAASTPTSAPTAPAPSTPTASAAAPSGAPDACSEIASSCHEHDSKGAGATKIHECHELGHAHKLDVCVARRQECLDACAGHAH